MTIARVSAPTTSAAASSATATASIPTSVVNGNLLIARISVVGGTGTTITPPGGWTFIRREDDTTVFGVGLYWRIANGDTPGATYSWSLSPSVNCTTDMVAYSDVDRSNPIQANSGQANASSVNVSAPTLTTTRPNTMVLYYGGTVSPGATFTPPSGYTEFSDTNSEEIAEKLTAAPGATGTVTGVASAAAVNVGQLVAINPQPVPPLLLAPTLFTRATQATLRM